MFIAKRKKNQPSQQLETIENIGKIPMENIQILPKFPISNLLDGPLSDDEIEPNLQTGMSGPAGLTGLSGSADCRPPLTRQDSVIEAPIIPTVGHRGDTPPGYMRVRILPKVYTYINHLKYRSP